jgi:flavodoxin
MTTIVVYYSYSGQTKKIAEKTAAKESADIAPITDVRRPNKLKAYTLGCFAAIRGKAWKIKPLDKKLASYERIILLSPVWASSTPPAVNALLELLPDGKKIAVIMVSAGGKSECESRLKAIIEAKNCKLESFQDIKGK